MNPVTTDRITMPITSSMMAADSMVVPTAPFNLPSSLSVSTVMETLVAVMITPTNTQDRMLS